MYNAGRGRPTRLVDVARFAGQRYQRQVSGVSKSTVRQHKLRFFNLIRQTANWNFLHDMQRSLLQTVLGQFK